MRKNRLVFAGIIAVSLGFSMPVNAATGWVWVEDTDYTVAAPAAPGAQAGQNSTGTIDQDWGIFTDILISRDNGSTWFPIVENDSKQFQWGQPTTLASVNIPVGTYTLSKNKQSSEWLICTLKIDHDNDNDANDLVTVPNVTVDLGGDAGSFCTDSINLRVARNESAQLSMNNPIVGCWVQVSYDNTSPASVVSSLTVVDTEDDIDREEAGGDKYETT